MLYLLTKGRNILPFLFLLALSPALGQDTLKIANAKQKAIEIASRMEYELSLSSTQKKQVESIAETRFLELAKATQTDASRLKINQKAWSKLSTILSKDQYEKYLTLRAELRQKKEEFLRSNPSYQFSKDDLDLDF